MTYTRTDQFSRMLGGMMAGLFISYSSRDERAAAGLQTWLREHEYDAVLIQRSKKQERGDFAELQPRLQSAIDKAELTLLLVTPFWQAAELCQKEMEWARSNHKPLLAILEAPAITDFPDQVPLIDMTRNREGGLVALKNVLEKLVTKGTKTQSLEGQGDNPDFDVDDVTLQGTVFAHHERTKKGPGKEQPALMRPVKRREESANRTLKILRKGIRWSAFPFWLTKVFKLPVAGTIVKKKKPLFSALKKVSFKTMKIKPLLKRGADWVVGDKVRVMGAAFLLFVFVTALIGMISDSTFGSKDAMRKELANVKKRQTLFLSRVANHLRETGDEETALLLALESLQGAQGTDDLQQARDSLYAAWIKSQKSLVMSGHDNHVSGAMFSPDGKFILSASWDRTARVWSLATKKQVLVLDKHDGFVNSAVYSPDQSLILTAALDNKARLFNGRTGKLIRELKGHSHDLTSAMFSANGRRIVTASGDQTARMWDVAGGQLVKTFLGHKAGLESAVFSPDGSRIVTASADKIVRILDVASAKQLAVLEGHGGVVRNVRFDPRGDVIATASEDKTVRLWGGRNGVFLRVLKGHKWAVLSVEFSRDGSRLVTASKDNTARVWDVKTGELLLILRGHKGIVSQASFSPDGKTVVTASGDGTMRLWPLPASDNDLVARARGTVAKCLTPSQRKKYFLGESPPDWCARLKKRSTRK